MHSSISFLDPSKTEILFGAPGIANETGIVSLELTHVNLGTVRSAIAVWHFVCVLILILLEVSVGPVINVFIPVLDPSLVESQNLWRSEYVVSSSLLTYFAPGAARINKRYSSGYVDLSADE